MAEHRPEGELDHEDLHALYEEARAVLAFGSAPRGGRGPAPGRITPQMHVDLAAKDVYGLASLDKHETYVFNHPMKGGQT